MILLIKMYFFIFACFLITIEGLHVTTPLPSSKSVISHNLYANTAKLIHLVNNLENDKPVFNTKRNNGGRMSDTDELIIKLLQILQKKYDSNRDYNGFVNVPMIRVHYISNPDVLDKFRTKSLDELVELKEYLRRNEDNELLEDRDMLNFNDRESNEMYATINKNYKSDSKPIEKDEDYGGGTKHIHHNYYEDSKTINDITSRDMHTRTTRIPRILTFEDVIPKTRYKNNDEDIKKEYVDIYDICTLEAPKKRNYDPNLKFKVHLKDDEYSLWDDRLSKDQNNNEPIPSIENNIKNIEPEKTDIKFNKQRHDLVENNKNSVENTKAREIHKGNEADKASSNKNSNNGETYNTDRYKYESNKNIRNDDQIKDSVKEIRNDNFDENSSQNKKPHDKDGNFGRQSTTFIETFRQSKGMNDKYENSNKKYYRNNETPQKPIKSYWTQEHKPSSESEGCDSDDDDHNSGKKKDEFIRLSSEVNAQYIKWGNERDDSKKHSEDATRSGSNKKHKVEFKQKENDGKKHNIEKDPKKDYDNKHNTAYDQKEHDKKHDIEFFQNENDDNKHEIETKQKNNYAIVHDIEFQQKENLDKKHSMEIDQKENYDKKHNIEYDQRDNYDKKHNTEYDQRANYDKNHNTEYDQRDNYDKKHEIEFELKDNNDKKHDVEIGQRDNYDKKDDIEYEHKDNYDKKHDIELEQKDNDDKNPDIEFDQRHNYNKKHGIDINQKANDDENVDNIDKKISERKKIKEKYNKDYNNNDETSDFRKRSTFDYDNDNKQYKKHNIERDKEKPRRTKHSFENKDDINDNQNWKNDYLEKNTKKKPKINDDWDRNNNDWESKKENNNDWNKKTTKYHENRYTDEYKKNTKNWNNENNGNIDNDWSKVGISKNKPARTRPERSDNYRVNIRERERDTERDHESNFKPKIPKQNYDTYNQKHERNPARQGFGHTSIPYSGKKIIYDD